MNDLLMIKWSVGSRIFSLEKLRNSTESIRLVDADGVVCEWSLDEARLLGTKLVEIANAKATRTGRLESQRSHAPWNQAEEDELRRLWAQTKSVAKIAKVLGRTQGGIHSRLVRLGIVSYDASKLTPEDQ